MWDLENKQTKIQTQKQIVVDRGGVEDGRNGDNSLWITLRRQKEIGSRAQEALASSAEGVRKDVSSFKTEGKIKNPLHKIIVF